MRVSSAVQPGAEDRQREAPWRETEEEDGAQTELNERASSPIRGSNR
jgi:hypothetical protein